MRYREPLRARRLEMGRTPIFCVHIAQTLHKIHIDMSQQPNILCELCSKYNTIAEFCKTNANHHSLHRNAAMFVQNMTVMYVTKFCAPEPCCVKQPSPAATLVSPIPRPTCRCLIFWCLWTPER